MTHVECRSNAAFDQNLTTACCSRSKADNQCSKGMTRAKRYANHAGGRKYSNKTGQELDKSSTHAGAKEKLAASEIFREVWNQCRDDEDYSRLKEQFMKEQKDHLREQKGGQKSKG